MALQTAPPMNPILYPLAAICILVAVWARDFHSTRVIPRKAGRRGLPSPDRRAALAGRRRPASAREVGLRTRSPVHCRQPAEAGLDAQAPCHWQSNLDCDAIG